MDQDRSQTERSDPTDATPAPDAAPAGLRLAGRKRETTLDDLSVRLSRIEGTQADHGKLLAKIGRGIGAVIAIFSTPSGGKAQITIDPEVAEFLGLKLVPVEPISPIIRPALIRPS